MQVHEDHFGFDLFQQLIGNAEGIVVGGHENASLQIDHGVGDALFAAFIHAPARHVGRIIRRAQQAAGGAVLVAVGGLKVVDDLALVPDVVAGGDDIDAQIEQVFRQRAGDAEAAGGVFSVRDHQIDGAVFHQAGQTVFDDVASGASENVADEENVHGGRLCFDGNTRKVVSRLVVGRQLGRLGFGQRLTTDD